MIKELTIGAPLESNSSEALAKPTKKIKQNSKKKTKKNHLKHDYKSFCGSGELEPVEKGESAGQIFNFFFGVFLCYIKIKIF